MGISLLLVSVGLLMIYSTTFSGSAYPSLLVRQSISLGIGLVFLFLAASIDYRYLRRLSVAGYGLSVILLVGVLIIGREISGSTRWFNLGFYQFQPVEFAKLALIVVLAAFFHTHLRQMHKFKYFFFSSLIAAVPIGLTLIQPDLGSALVLGFIWLGMLLASGVRKSHLSLLVVFFVIAASASWIFILQDYQKHRVETFFNPASDPLGRGYNALQSIIAVGSGGITGRGLARGVVSQLRFLPERQTDFIFASLAEELGFVGTVFLLGLLAAWYMRIIRVIRESRDNFGFFLSLGIFCYLFVQSAVNIAMNIGIMPITGIPLPLISYGGSSLLICLISVGILESVLIHGQTVKFS